jgi:hypothetical protein
VLRGSSAAVADPYDPPVGPVGTGVVGAGAGVVVVVSGVVGVVGVVCVVVVAESITVIVRRRVTVSAFAVTVLVPTETPLTKPVEEIDATLDGAMDQTIREPEICLPDGYITRPEICVVWPILIVVGLALIDIIVASVPGETAMVIVLVTPSAVADTVAEPVVWPAVRSPLAEIVATLDGETAQLTVAPLAEPSDRLGVAVACTCCPGTSDESVAVIAIEAVEPPIRSAFALPGAKVGC